MSTYPSIAKYVTGLAAVTRRGREVSDDDEMYDEVEEDELSRTWRTQNMAWTAYVQAQLGDLEVRFVCTT